MLNFLREKQSSYAVKILLGLIILSFAAFFGASTLDPGVNRSNTVAIVNSKPISSAKHAYYAGIVEERYKQYMKNLSPQKQNG